MSGLIMYSHPGSVQTGHLRPQRSRESIRSINESYFQEQRHLATNSDPDFGLCPKRNQSDSENKAKVTFSDDVACSGDYVMMTGSPSKMSSEEDTSHYVEMTPPKQWQQTAEGSASKKPLKSSLAGKHQCSNMTSPHGDITSMLKGKAILRLAIYVNSGMMTVHLISARHLQSSTSPLCDACVQVSLLPQDVHMPTCCTEVVRDTNHPVFEEKFSFELLPEDMSKRLYVSVWHKEGNSNRNVEFLGGMSFGVKHIYTHKRTVDGWYYLLQESTGQRKHVQAIGRKREKAKSQGNPTDQYKQLNEHPNETSTPYKTLHSSGHYETFACARIQEGLGSLSVDDPMSRNNKMFQSTNSASGYSIKDSCRKCDNIQSITMGIAQELDSCSPGLSHGANRASRCSTFGSKEAFSMQPRCQGDVPNGGQNEFTSSCVIGRAISV